MKGNVAKMITILPFEEKHWESVRGTYAEGLKTKNATFETEVPQDSSWVKKFHSHLFWVATSEGTVLGWAGLQPVSARKVYEGVVEVSVYIHPKHTRKGIGSALMKHLIYESEKAGIWTLYASIFPENQASIKLHLAHEFREIGYREKIGQLDGEWRNTVLFERRSKKVGI